MEKETKKFGMAVFACIFNPDLSKVLLIKRNAEKREKYGFDWAIVGGKIELGEYSQDALIREIKEELGLELAKDKVKLAFVKEDPNFMNRSHTAFFIYVAILEENANIVLNPEAEEYKWCNIDNLPTKRSDDDILAIRERARELF